MKLELDTSEPVGVEILTGLHQSWISGDDEDGTTFEVSTGAGVGNPHCMLRVELPDGTKLYDHFDMRPLVEQWVNKLRERGPVETVSDGG